MSAADGGSFTPQKIEPIDWPGRSHVSEAVRDVLAERRRQIEVEGFTAEHDDAYTGPFMAAAAGCYALYAGYPALSQGNPPPQWPWPSKWWKPNTPRHALVKAAALILAEIERLDRMTPNSN